ncbi:MAG: phosphoenolpyruvate--protein phosphotransferase [Deltaproteobacteria bacterium]|nr:phosphoenolpyruvate--protein phosphotransferase [Deltaproteobacteria bacterium]
MSDPNPDPDGAAQRLRGISGSPGIAIGPAVVTGPTTARFKQRNIAGHEADSEVQRFHAAVKHAKAGLRRVMQRAGHLGAELTILEAYILMLGDPILGDETERHIRVNLLCAEWAVSRAIQEMASQVMIADDLYLRERSRDFHFVGDMLVRSLRGEQDGQQFLKLDRPSIVVAHDLSPADTAAMVREPVIALVTEVGSRTSHTSIMARALEIPAVVGVADALSRINPGDELVVDGLRAEVTIGPSESELAIAREREQQHLTRCKRLRHTRDRLTTTACGVPIALRANIELPGEALLAVDHGAQGVGLYRTEFLYVDRASPPSEDEQYELYRTVIQTLVPHPVTLRTFDLGGDKFSSSFDVPSDLNPALGLRAVRLALASPELFLAQLRAMVRASAHGPMSVMIPMIATMTELRSVKALLARAIEQVDQRGLPRARHVPLGVMIEVPSAALLAESFAREADFLSLGTNDLVQYTLAADRTSRALAYLASPFDPSVLRLIALVVDAAAKQSTPLSICGEMASDPVGAILLVGLGLREMSMEASSVPEIKETLRRVTLAEAQEAARSVLGCETAEEVSAALDRLFAGRLADLLATG